MAESDDESGERPSSNPTEIRFLPLNCVRKLMKKALPQHSKISNRAKETVQECVSEFVSFVTAEAAEMCLRDKRRVINGDDVICALGTLGFGDYVEPLERYLAMYRATEGNKKKSSASSSQSQQKDRSSGGSVGDNSGGYGAAPGDGDAAGMYGGAMTMGQRKHDMPGAHHTGMGGGSARAHATSMLAGDTGAHDPASMLAGDAGGQKGEKQRRSKRRHGGQHHTDKRSNKSV